METAVMEENDHEEISEMNLDNTTEICENSQSVLKRKVQFEYNDRPLTKCARTASSENPISDHTISSDSDSVTSDHVDSTGAATTYPGGSCMLHTDPDLRPSAVGRTVASNDVGSNSLPRAPIAESTQILPTSSLVKAKKPFKLHRCRICLKIFAGADFLLKHLAEKHSKESNEQTSKIPKRVPDEIVGHNFRGDHLKIDQGHCEMTERKQEFQDLDYYTNDSSVNVKKEVQGNLDKELGHDDLDPEIRREYGRQVVVESSFVDNIKNEQEGCEVTVLKRAFHDLEYVSHHPPDCGTNNSYVDIKNQVQENLDKELGHDDLDREVSRENGRQVVPETSLEVLSPKNLKAIKPPRKKAIHSDDNEKLEEQRKEGEGECQEGINDNEQSEINKIRNFTTKFCKITKHKYSMSGGTSFWCEECGLRFITAESLRAHQAKNDCSGGNMDPSRPSVPPTTVPSTTITAFEESTGSDASNISKIEVKYHWCETCRLSFGTLASLRLHRFGGFCKLLSSQQSRVTSAKPSVTVASNVTFPSSKRSPHPKAGDKAEVMHFSCKMCQLNIVNEENLRSHLLSGSCIRIETEAETVNEAECETEACNLATINLGPESEPFPPVKLKQEKTDIDGDTSDKLYKMPVETSVRHGCHLCGMAFPTDFLLKSHMSFHGRNGSSGFVCNVCNIKFTEIEALLVHRKRESHHLTFSCYFCKKKFDGQVALKRHLREKHRGRNVNKPRCVFCDMVRESDSDIHTGTHLRQLLLCEVCDLGFLKKENLTKHLRTHSQDDIHSCRICAEHFDGVNELMNHMKTHRFSHVNSYVPGHFKDHVKFHPGTNKPYICNICNVSYSNGSMHALINHLLVHQQQQSQYDCQKCWMHFVTKNHRGKHKCLLNH